MNWGQKSKDYNPNPGMDLTVIFQVNCHFYDHYGKLSLDYWTSGSQKRETLEVTHILSAGLLMESIRVLL